MYCVSSQLLSQYQIVRIFVVSLAIVIRIFIRTKAMCNGQSDKKGEKIEAKNLTANSAKNSTFIRFAFVFSFDQVSNVIWKHAALFFVARSEFVERRTRTHTSPKRKKREWTRTIKWIDAIDPIVLIRTAREENTPTTHTARKHYKTKQCDTYEINVRKKRG